MQTAKDDGLYLEFVLTPTSAEMVTFLGTGQVDAGLMPYTSFIALHDKGAPVYRTRAGRIGVAIFRVNALIMTLGVSVITLGVLTVQAQQQFTALVPGFVVALGSDRFARYIPYDLLVWAPVGAGMPAFMAGLLVRWKIIRR